MDSPRSSATYSEQPRSLSAVRDDDGSAWESREPKPTAFQIWRMPVLLFLLTAVSVVFFGGGGFMWLAEGVSGAATPLALVPQILARGVPVAVTLLAILVCHEFGHYFAARAHRVEASPPYFIPFPSLLGTMGAVIRMRGNIPTRSALVDIGASGPIAGFVVAVPLLLYGLSLSHVEATGASPPLIPLASPLGLLMSMFQEPAQPQGLLMEGSSLIYLLAKKLVVGTIPEGSDVMLHPIAMAAWFGLLVTAINLIPIGQLDGGHVLYAVLGERARTVGRVMVGGLVVLGFFASFTWLMWAFLGWKIVGTRHPPVSDPYEPLGPGRRAIAWCSLAMFVVTFVPVPMQQL